MNPVGVTDKSADVSVDLFDFNRFPMPAGTRGPAATPAHGKKGVSGFFRWAAGDVKSIVLPV